MAPSGDRSLSGWQESDSRIFLQYGELFVPYREQQLATICTLLPVDLRARPVKVLDLCCGGGALSEAILDRVPESVVYGLDGSETMLEHARRRLARFGGRFQASLVDLGDLSWRGRFQGLHAVVSSVAIHHLDDDGKRRLFTDLHAMLGPGGVVIIADLIAPAGERATALAAGAWDETVRERSQETGAEEAFAAFERLRWNMYRYPDEDDIDKPSRLLHQLKWLEEAGFENVDVYWMYAGHAIFGGEKPA